MVEDDAPSRVSFLIHVIPDLIVQRVACKAHHLHRMSAYQQILHLYWVHWCFCVNVVTKKSFFYAESSKTAPMGQLLVEISHLYMIIDYLTFLLISLANFLFFPLLFLTALDLYQSFRVDISMVAVSCLVYSAWYSGSIFFLYRRSCIKGKNQEGHIRSENGPPV